MATAAYCAAFAALGLVFSALGPTLPSLAQNTRAALSDISFLFVARGIGSMIGSIWGGRLLDRFPGHRLVAAAVASGLAMAALIPLVGTLWALTGVLLIMGITFGTLNVSGNTLIIWLHGDNVPPFMNLLHFSYGVGTFISPLIVAQTLNQPDGLRCTYWLLALLTLPAALYPLFLRSPRPLRRQVHEAPKPFNASLAALLALIFFGYAAASYAFGGWIFTYATRMGLADDAAGAYLTSLYWGALTAGRLISIPLAARMPPNRILLIDIVGGLASTLVIALFPASLAALAVGSGGLGFFLATIFPTTMSLAGRTLPITGKVTSIFSVGSSLGALVIPWLVGQFFESVGPQVLTTLLLVDLGLTLGVYGLLSRKIRQVEIDSQSTR